MKKLIKKLKKKKISKTYKYIFSILFILIITLVVFYNPIFRNLGTIQWDAKEVHLYNLIFSSSTWNQKNILPLWNPYIFNGFPQIADPQVAIFYPVNFLIALITVFSAKILMYQIVLHYFLAGLFMFLLVKYIFKDYLIGLFAAIAYMFSGFMVGHASHVGMQNTATWLPLIFLITLLLIKKKKFIFSILLGLALAFSFLAGHFQTFLYIFFFLIVFLIYKIIQDKKFIKFKNLKFIALPFVIFLLLVSIQLIPTYQLTKESVRTKLSLELSQTESLNPKSLLNFLNPNHNNVAFSGPYRGPWDRTQNYLFIGISTIILSLIGAIFSKHKLKSFLLLMFVIAITYSLGKYFFAQPIFYKLIPFLNKIRAPSNMMLITEFCLILLAASGFKFVKDKMKKKIPYLALFILFIIILEIIPITKINTLLYARARPDSIARKPYIVEKILNEYDYLDKNLHFSTYRLNEIGMDRNFTQIFNIYSFDGYNPLMLRRQANYEDAMVKNATLVDLAGIKYLPCKYIASRVDILRKIGEICINNQYYSRLFFVKDYIVAKNQSEALSLLSKTDLQKYVILEEEPNKNKNNFKEKDVRIKIMADNPGFWNIEIDNENDGFLVIRETFYPGWQAKINGIDTEIYRANYLFKAVFLQGGKNSVILNFKPKLF